MINKSEIETFESNGYLIIKDFYDINNDIFPIWKDVYEIIGILIDKYNLNIERKPFNGQNFAQGYTEIISHDRKFGAEVYDAVKQLPSFIRLCCNPLNTELFRLLRKTETIGIAGNGMGIRINNPLEEKYRAEWHQDYNSQLRSPDGLVFWSPLVPVTKENGPVVLCKGSHKAGIAKVIVDKSSTYDLKIADEEGLHQYTKQSPLTKPGDLLLIDFLNIHRSGLNKSQMALWTMQFRFFNFNNPDGQKINWSGAFASGVDFEDIHPEFVTTK